MKTPDDVAAMVRLKACGWGVKRIARELGWTDPPVADFYAALPRHNGAAPLADFLTALNTPGSLCRTDRPGRAPFFTPSARQIQDPGGIGSGDPGSGLLTAAGGAGRRCRLQARVVARRA